MAPSSSAVGGSAGADGANPSRSTPGCTTSAGTARSSATKRETATTRSARRAAARTALPIAGPGSRSLCWKTSHGRGRSRVIAGAAVKRPRMLHAITASGRTSRTTRRSSSAAAASRGPAAIRSPTVARSSRERSSSGATATPRARASSASPPGGQATSGSPTPTAMSSMRRSAPPSTGDWLTNRLRSGRGTIMHAAASTVGNGRVTRRVQAPSEPAVIAAACISSG